MNVERGCEYFAASYGNQALGGWEMLPPLWPLLPGRLPRRHVIAASHDDRIIVGGWRRTDGLPDDERLK